LGAADEARQRRKRLPATTFWKTRARLTGIRARFGKNALVPWQTLLE
jgi:hypothetical protein